MLLRILTVLFLASAMTLFAQVTTNPVAIAPGSDMPPIEPGVSQELAKWRAARYSDVRYKLNLTLEKMSPVLKGTMEIRVKLSEPGAIATGSIVPIILDWRKIKGHEEKSTISNVVVNGKAVKNPVAIAPGSDSEHLIFSDGVIAGENVIKLDFTSPILTSGSAITRYVDKEDGAEYIYSLFVPSDASTAFPVFDQPDLKARFELTVDIVGRDRPTDWKIASNSPGNSGFDSTWTTRWRFEETKPISTYVFAFAAGPFERVEHTGGNLSGSEGVSPPANRNTLPTGRVSALGSEPGAVATGLLAPGNPVAIAPGSDRTPPTSIYVRKSQAAKFKPHAAEVFRLNREAIKYFEEYFDYKFPFPKYDLVLIPEFPFGGMEHAGATFLRESAIIFPQEPTKNDHISRAVLIFHEAAHQWFGDTVTMRWFDDLWLKEGFANFAAYKAMEKIMPEANAWKVFYERVKQAAYRTDSTKGTTPIYQEIKNLSAAKSAYGNIVYNKAPAFLRQAEFYLGEDKFQTAVRAFLKKHEFKNAGWEDLVTEFEVSSKQDLKEWANTWVTKRGVPLIRTSVEQETVRMTERISIALKQSDQLREGGYWRQRFNVVSFGNKGDGGEKFYLHNAEFDPTERPNEPKRAFPMEARIFWSVTIQFGAVHSPPLHRFPRYIFPNHNDYGYGIFLLDKESRKYFLRNLVKVDDPFARSMMWGSLWDSVREGELEPREYVELVVKVLMQKPAREQGRNTQLPDYALANARASASEDESTIATLLGRTSTALNYYIGTMQKPDREGGRNGQGESYALANARASASTGDLPVRVENMLIERMQNAETAGQRITYYRAFLNVAASENAREVLKDMLKGGNPSGSEGVNMQTQKDTLPTGRVSASVPSIPLRTKDKFDIVTRLLILGDADGPKLLAELEKTETTDEAKRYAYAAKAGIATAENKAKYWNDFVNNKEISESWIEAAFGPWNSIRHSELTLPYLQKALQELPNHKRSRKIFFVNGWLGAFIGGQRSEEALAIVNKFLADNPKLDKDLRLKILENVDVIERAVKIRAKYGKN